MKRSTIVKTTVGELIEALTEEASALVPRRKKAYGLAALALAHLLSNARRSAPATTARTDR